MNYQSRIKSNLVIMFIAVVVFIGSLTCGLHLQTIEDFENIWSIFYWISFFMYLPNYSTNPIASIMNPFRPKIVIMIFNFQFVGTMLLLADRMNLIKKGIKYI